jgi:hypothetical protein
VRQLPTACPSELPPADRPPERSNSKSATRSRNRHCVSVLEEQARCRAVRENASIFVR